ncbi:hypothetical protein BKA65DRAFT_480969 [Rhexocercosporidium sp. MPI-PUGE-AT-0058]|nr:hypothetical protein BKA65DRAFT_480969 [Rhexocercosporidium sp. MPI-PUGE-AT-0058]
MIRIDLEKVVGAKDYQASNSLLTARTSFWNPWKSRNTRPSKTTVWRSVGLAVFLQGLVCWKLFFRSEPVYIGPTYNVTETVGLVTAYYELLRDMRYTGRDMIAYPPHAGTLAINVTLATKLGLDEAVIQTMQQLPYITPHEDQYNKETDAYMSEPELRKLHENDAGWWEGWIGQNRDIFWRNGHFVDYRNYKNVRLARDPLRRIVALNTQGGNRGSDPFFGRFNWNKIPLEYKVHKKVYYGEDTINARLAPDLLRGFIHLTSRLESGYLPGSVRTDENYTPELSPPRWENWVQTLYRDYGWPAGEPLEECQYMSLRRNNTCDHNPMDNFKAKPFDQAMSSLRHNITVRYMADWYCPVPRREDVITHLKNNKTLTEDQIAYAESGEPVRPLNLESWGGRLPFMQG